MAAALLNLCPNLENFSSVAKGLKAIAEAYPMPKSQVGAPRRRSPQGLMT